jgi:hypothetical protein
MPSGVPEDGIRFVSMSGPFLVGSGKSGTPFSRMHRANARRAFRCRGVAFVPVNPAGSRLLHAVSARSNAAELVSTDEPFATPSMVILPDASGSGNALTPCPRMHSANRTAFRLAVTVVLGAAWALLLLPLLLLPWAPPPQPALITATVAARTTAERCGSDHPSW